MTLFYGNVIINMHLYRCKSEFGVCDIALIKILQSIWDCVHETLGSLPPEAGGILGGTSELISKFYFDDDARVDRAHYYPTVNCLNKVIEAWGMNGISFVGIIHSHQYSDMRLSFQDITFARAIIESNSSLLDRVLVAIVSSEFDSDTFFFTFYSISLDSVACLNYQVIEDI